MEWLRPKELEARKLNYDSTPIEVMGNANIKDDVISTYQELRDKGVT